MENRIKKAPRKWNPKKRWEKKEVVPRPMRPADGSYLEKLTSTGRLQVDAAGGFAQFIVNWCRPGISGVNEYFFNDAPAAGQQHT